MFYGNRHMIDTSPNGVVTMFHSWQTRPPLVVRVWKISLERNPLK